MNGYKNFNAAIYCPVGDLINLTDLDKFSEQLDWIEKQVRVGKVYLETYRHGRTIDRDQIERLIEFFNKRGIETSGGITTDAPPGGEGGFDPLCYTSNETIGLLTKVVELTASLFDEFILDDFYFTNCRCQSCIEAKGERTWAQFRLDLMRDISENVIIKTAKRVNPNVKVIIKYPNWYEHYQDSGYNLEDEPRIFDMVYTGTETRNPAYTQQHLPKYLSYFLMRYLENIAPGRNGGGWYDPYECTYNYTSYAQQAYLTLLAKAREVMMFSLGSLLSPQYSLCIPINGQIFSDMDKVLGLLGNPTGTACYLPVHGHGEDYLHDYIGMLGIPLEPVPEYPRSARTVFLTESAAIDCRIIEKVKGTLSAGGTVIVTSGFLKAASPMGFQKELANVVHTSRKAMINTYAYSDNGGVTFGGRLEAAKSVVIPQLEFMTNDTWELVAGLGEDNGFPLLLKTIYGKGRLYIMTIPDDYGDLYHYPRKILYEIRRVFCPDSPVKLDAFSKVAMFTYDNNCFALHSFQPWYDEIRLVLRKDYDALLDLVSGRILEARPENEGMVVRLRMIPGINYIFEPISK
ncbi:MAG TPA: permease [Candidatus Atribacteria bacterium]|nr:permease [Candidatus Atribacteria bacterium]HPT78290.1 permease [Candidatus Atribacteria bacterium]